MTDVLFPVIYSSTEKPFETIGEGGTGLTGGASAPIGVFDSGSGGLTILAELRRKLPHENYLYYGDTAHCPYGTRSEVEIVELTTRAIRFMIGQGVKLVVVACNTASLAGLDALRATFQVPFVGVAPAVETAARLTRRGCIGIAATDQTTRSLYLGQLIDAYAGGVRVLAVGCPELVTLVENGVLDGPIAQETVRRALEPLLKEGADVIVLGCTHFPALRPLIERIAGHDVQVIDSAAEVTYTTCLALDGTALAQPAYSGQQAQGHLQVWCSGNPRAFSSVASKLLGYPIFARRAWPEREPYVVKS